jgi:hypothetical protein
MHSVNGSFPGLLAVRQAACRGCLLRYPALRGRRVWHGGAEERRALGACRCAWWLGWVALARVDLATWSCCASFQSRVAGREAAAGLAFAELAFAELAFAELAFAGLVFVELAFAGLAFVELVFAELAFAGLAFVELAFVELAFVELAFVELAFVGLAFVGLASDELAFAAPASAGLRHAAAREVAALASLYASAQALGWDAAPANIVRLEALQCQVWKQNRHTIPDDNEAAIAIICGTPTGGGGA